MQVLKEKENFLQTVHDLAKKHTRETLQWDYYELDEDKTEEVWEAIYPKIAPLLPEANINKIYEAIDNHIHKYLYRNLSDKNVEDLASAVLLRTVKDYCRAPKEEKDVILKRLKGGWMEFFTNGQSLIVAEQLPIRERAIRNRLKIAGELN